MQYDKKRRMAQVLKYKRVDGIEYERPAMDDRGATTKDSERARRTEGMYSQPISIIIVMRNVCTCARQNRARRLAGALRGGMKVIGHTQEASGSSPGGW